MNYIQYCFKDSNFWIYFLFVLFLLVIGVNNLIKYNKIILFAWCILIILSGFKMYYINKIQSKAIINIIFIINFFLLILFASEYYSKNNLEICSISILFSFILNIFLLAYVIIKKYFTIIVIQIIILFLILILMCYSI